MRQRIIHGAFVDMVTPDELYKAIRRPVEITRIRASETVQLDANGTSGGPVAVYKVPIGTEFDIRRVSFELSGVTELNLQGSSVSLASVGTSIRYFRSGNPIEFAYPVSPVASSPARVPGVQTWGDQQGPYMRNGEVFQIASVLQVAQATWSLTMTVEGILVVNRQNA